MTDAVTSQKSKYRIDVQVLRGFSVLAVILFHANENLFPLGYLGVDVFFVISGFVVTPLILDVFNSQNVSIRLKKLIFFYRRRFYRLLPAVLFMIILTFIPILLLDGPANHQNYARQGLATLLLIGNIGAFKYDGDYFSSVPNPLVHTWSLAVEEQIFLILPMLLFILLLRSNILKPRINLVYGILFLTSLMIFLMPSSLQWFYDLVDIRDAKTFNFYSPFSRAWEFICGGILSLNIKSIIRPGKINELFAHVLNVSLVILLFSSFELSPQIGSLLSCLLAANVLAFQSLSKFSKTINKVMKWLGDRSYSIYLLHMPLLYIARFSPVTAINNHENRTIQILIAITFSSIMGNLSFKFVENRFRLNENESRTFSTRSKVRMVMFFVLPWFSLLSLNFTSNTNYFGFKDEIKKPFAAWNTDVNCSDFVERSSPCIYLGNNSSKTVLLIGDSHAAHLSTTLLDVGRELNWNVEIWALASCKFQLQESPSELLSRQCINQNLDILRWASKSKPDVIIVSQYVYSRSSQVLLRKGLAELKLRAPNVLLVENNPIFPDKTRFMTEMPIVMSKYNPPTEFLRTQMDTSNKSASDSLASWARKFEISTLDLSTTFCNSESCSRFSNGEWLYIDSDHFSLAGAKLVAPKFVEYLRQIPNL